MIDLEKAVKDCIRTELKMYRPSEGPIEVREDILDSAFRIALSEQINAIQKQAIAEYHLVMGDFEKAKYYHKQYTKELKGLL
jgi:hypothetical protein